MPYTPIIGCLAYILSADRKKTLMIHRIAREDDDHLGKYNGIGGKMEPNEDVLHAMRREIFEEAGITTENIQLRGTINWTNFGPRGEDWLGFIFLVDSFTGTPNKICDEGPLEWVDIDQLDQLPMWEGDRHFLPLVFDGDPRPFHGYMPYKDDQPQSWQYQRI